MRQWDGFAFFSLSFLPDHSFRFVYASGFFFGDGLPPIYIRTFWVANVESLIVIIWILSVEGALSLPLIAGEPISRYRFLSLVYPEREITNRKTSRLPFPVTNIRRTYSPNISAGMIPDRHEGTRFGFWPMDRVLFITLVRFY